MKSWYQSRTIWCALLALACIFGLIFGPEAARTALEGALVALVGGVIYGRVKAERSIQIGKPKLDPTDFGPPLILLACLMAAGPIACQPSGPPTTQQASISIEQQYQASAVTYQTALLELIALRQNGVIDDAAYRQIEPFRAMAWAYLQQMQTAATAGQQVTFAQLLPAFNQAISDWAAVQPKKVK